MHCSNFCKTKCKYQFTYPIVTPTFGGVAKSVPKTFFGPGVVSVSWDAIQPRDQMLTPQFPRVDAHCRAHLPSPPRPQLQPQLPHLLLCWLQFQKNSDGNSETLNHKMAASCPSRWTWPGQISVTGVTLATKHTH